MLKKLFKICVFFGFFTVACFVFLFYNPTLEPCPETPPNLLGPINVEFKTKRTLDDVREELGQLLQDGGLYKPPDCIAQQKVGLHQGCPNLFQLGLDSIM